MTWTYIDPTTGRKDEVRAMIGDTVTADPLLQDEEIENFLTRFPPVIDKPPWLAAAASCDAIAGRYARKVQQTIGSLSRAAQQAYEHYRQMAADFRILYSTNGKGNQSVIAAAPVLGGGGRTYLGGTHYTNPEGS